MAKTYGSVVAGLTDRDRFWLAVHVGPECWEWQGQVNGDGYGNVKRLSATKKTVGAHRVSWEYAYGPIPSGLLVLHHCDNPPCVRPNHLFLGTHRDNAADMILKGRRRPDPTGANGYRSKLTPELAVEIRARYFAGETQDVLAGTYGVSRGLIHNVVRGKHWTCRVAEI